MTAEQYHGSCQCGAVSYRTTADLSKTFACNCSRCGRLGTILAFVPESDFELISGDGSLTEYQFNKHVIHHLFCSTCGVQSFSRGTAPDGKKMVAINARCLDGVDPDALSPTKVDGRSR